MEWKGWHKVPIRNGRFLDADLIDFAQKDGWRKIDLRRRDVPSLAYVIVSRSFDQLTKGIQVCIDDLSLSSSRGILTLSIAYLEKEPRSRRGYENVFREMEA
jgi:hypothetical protein